jgi:hypothetical protein
MPQLLRVFYESANGDCWALGRRPGAKFPFVLHMANEPSGGMVTNIEVGAFLRRGPWNAEQQALLGLIGSLVPEADDEAEPGAGRGDQRPGDPRLPG